ncbi:MAG: DNA repair protein RecO [Alphaproteobacteria bacterium]|nr:DNA repair protein RecO [Alphaproteobacteria bacterium]
MQWREISIILSIKSFSENARIVTLFNKSLGKISAIFKNTKSSLQMGDVCDIFWKGRSSEDLGKIKIEEIIFSPFCRVFQDSAKIFAVDSACSMCANGLLTAAPHEQLFIYLMNFLLSIQKENWVANYVFFEMSLLAEVGYGLDLSKCAVTGAKEGLAYVSPKTGCAVTKEVGWMYKDKLFPLPEFLISEKVIPNKYDIFCALNITGHFLKAYFYGINESDLPLSRSYLTEIIASCHEDVHKAM